MSHHSGITLKNYFRWVEFIFFTLIIPIIENRLLSMTNGIKYAYIVATKIFPNFSLGGKWQETLPGSIDIANQKFRKSSSQK